MGKHSARKRPVGLLRRGADRVPRIRRSVLAAVLAGLVAVTAVTAFALYDDDAAEPRKTAPASATRPECVKTVPLSVTADPSIATAVRRLAPALLDPARASDRMCVRVDVLEAASADVAAQLAAPGGNAVAVRRCGSPTPRTGSRWHAPPPKESRASGSRTSRSSP